jgi:hypothetical protein
MGAAHSLSLGAIAQKGGVVTAGSLKQSAPSPQASGFFPTLKPRNFQNSKKSLNRLNLNHGRSYSRLSRSMQRAVTIKPP